MASVFVYCLSWKRARCALARCVHGNVATAADGTFIVRLNCHHTSMLSRSKNQSAAAGRRSNGVMAEFLSATTPTRVGSTTRSVAFSVFYFVRAIALSISSVPVAAPAPGHELRRHLMTASSPRARENAESKGVSAGRPYDEGHQIGNTPRLAGLQISDYDACSLDIPAASPNFGLARVLIERTENDTKNSN